MYLVAVATDAPFQTKSGVQIGVQANNVMRHDQPMRRRVTEKPKYFRSFRDYVVQTVVISGYIIC